MDQIDARDRWEKVLERLREMVLRGELRPGERLREEDLATLFGVSRGPVREAIRALEVSGLAVRVQRRGSFVSPFGPHDLEEVFSLRGVLEELAVRRAMTKHPLDVVSELERCIRGMREADASGDRDALLEYDLAFHSAFYAAADHGRLLATWRSLIDPIRVLVSVTSQALSRTVPDHELILAAARRGPDECVAAVRAHLAAAYAGAIGEEPESPASGPTHDRRRRQRAVVTKPSAPLPRG